MNKTPWLFALTSALIAILLGFANVVAKIGVNNLWPWIQPVANALQPQVLEWIWLFTALGVLVPLLDRQFGAHQFQKQRAQRILDHLVAEIFDGETKIHRITLYKAVRGYRVWAGILLNRLWRQDEKWITLTNLLHVRPSGLYLYPWARPKKSANPFSCAVWRVYRAKRRDCDGMAGMVWQNDTHTVLNVQHDFAPGELRDVKSFKTLPEAHPAMQYAGLTNVRHESQLRGRETYGRHFHGMVLEDPTGTKWGVVLLDSSAVRCPIPETQKGDAIKTEFRRYAEVLSLILT